MWYLTTADTDEDYGNAQGKNRWTWELYYTKALKQCMRYIQGFEEKIQR